jgi:hypothetical protein
VFENCKCEARLSPKKLLVIQFSFGQLALDRWMCNGGWMEGGKLQRESLNPSPFYLRLQAGRAIPQRRHAAPQNTPAKHRRTDRVVFSEMKRSRRVIRRQIAEAQSPHSSHLTEALISPTCAAWTSLSRGRRRHTLASAALA